MVVQGAPVLAALSAFIPDPTVTKVVAVALATAAGLIGYNNHGRGVIIAFAWIPGQIRIPHWICFSIKNLLYESHINYIFSYFYDCPCI